MAARTLYGSDRVVTASPSLAPLAPADVLLLISRRDQEGIGVNDGDHVRVTSSRGTLELPVETDDATPAGVAFLAFNRAGSGAADLVDAAAPVTDLRVETIS